MDIYVGKTASKSEPIPEKEAAKRKFIQSSAHDKFIQLYDMVIALQESTEDIEDIREIAQALSTTTLLAAQDDMVDSSDDSSDDDIVEPAGE